MKWKQIGAAALAAALGFSPLASISIKAADKPLEYGFYKYYMTDTTFTPPAAGLYRVIVVGASGDGGKGGAGGAGDFNREESGGSGGGGAGGSSGAIAVSDLKLTTSSSFVISFSGGKTSFGTSMYAENGANGGDGGNGRNGDVFMWQVGKAGQPSATVANAVGGNVANEQGYRGGRGGGNLNNVPALAEDGDNGGGKAGVNGGPYGTNNYPGGGGARYADIPAISKYLKPSSAFVSEGFCAGTGKTIPRVGPYSGAPGNNYLEWRNDAIVLSGGGGGASAGAGQHWNDDGHTPNNGWGSGANGGKGQPGVVIIERCTDQTPPVVGQSTFTGTKITLNATDEFGVAGFYINGVYQAGNPVTYSVPAGVSELAIQAEDRAGNKSAITYEYVLPTAPTITSSPAKEWANKVDGGSTITLRGTDLHLYPGAQLQYSFNNIAWENYNAPFVITASNTVYARVTCNNGNSPVTAKSVKVDVYPPYIAGADVDETNMEARKLTVTASDVGDSGVKGIYLDGAFQTVPYVYIIPNSKESVTLQAEDNAGNRSDPIQKAVKHVDTIPPTFKTVAFADDRKTVTVTMEDDRHGYGVKGVYINGTLEEGNPVVWTIPDDVAILRMQAVDVDDNKSVLRRDRVPDRTVITNELKITTFVFSDDNKSAIIEAANSDPATTIRGIYCNGKLLAGASIIYEIPEGERYLEVQAINNEGDRSAKVKKRIPGWWEVTSEITVDPVRFSEDNKQATITGHSSAEGTSINGIFVDDALQPGNPVSYEIPEAKRYIQVQAQNNLGDRSSVYNVRVPGWWEVTDSISILPVEFTDGNRKAIIKAESSAPWTNITGITVNGQLFEGNPVTYNVNDTEKYLELQAINNEGDKSPLYNVRVPGWSQVTGNISILPVEFRENNTKAVIEAVTIDETTIFGTYINDVLYKGNPVTYKIPDATEQLWLQAVNSIGDKSDLFNLQIPEWTDGVHISSVNFSDKADKATVKAVDKTGSTIKGIYINDEFFEGSTVEYEILNGTKHLTLQAINNKGDESEIVTKRVPGWSEIVDTITVKSIEFSTAGYATITAESTEKEVAGIYVNDKLYSGNPVLYTIQTGTKTLKVQAENTDGDKSPIVYKEVTIPIPGDPAVVNTLAVTGVEFSMDGIATVTAESSSTEVDVTGIYVNEKLFDGNPVLYPVPSGTKTLKLQAENAAGERSPALYKKVELPAEGEASIVDSLSIKSIEFSGTKTATITAMSTDARVRGIYINDKFYEGNPVVYNISSGKTIKAQAENINGERSPVVYKEVPEPPTSSSSTDSTGDKNSKTTKISITPPDWTNAKKAKVRITASDKNGIEIIEASTDNGIDEDITDSEYLYITENTTVRVEVTNSKGDTTKKTMDIECFDRDAPTVSVSQPDDNKLSIRATDKGSGLAAVYVNDRSYKQLSGGQLQIDIPNGATSMTIRAEDHAGNQSDNVAYPIKKPAIANPVATSSTTTIVEPTKVNTSSTEEVSAESEDGLAGIISEADTEITADETKKPSIAGIVALVISLLAIVGWVAWTIYSRKKMQVSEGDYPVDEEFDLDYDQYQDPSDSDTEDLEDTEEEGDPEQSEPAEDEIENAEEDSKPRIVRVS